MPHPAPTHDANGYFAKGNKLGRGNPAHKRMGQLRKAFIKAVTPEDVLEVGKKLMEKAKSGDIPAARLFLDHVLGRAPQHIELTGPEGQALGLSLADIQIAIFQSIADLPEARARVASALRTITHKPTNADGDANK